MEWDLLTHEKFSGMGCGFIPEIIMEELWEVIT